MNSAVEGRHKLKTGVDRLHGESIAMQLTDNDRAGTAVASAQPSFVPVLPRSSRKKLSSSSSGRSGVRP